MVETRVETIEANNGSGSSEVSISENGDAKDEATAAYNKAVEMYNAAVSAEEEVAGQFNTEIREYKAANPG